MTKGRWNDKWMNNTKAIYPSNFFKVWSWGHKCMFRFLSIEDNSVYWRQLAKISKPVFLKKKNEIYTSMLILRLQLDITINWKLCIETILSSNDFYRSTVRISGSNTTEMVPIPTKNPARMFTFILLQTKTIRQQMNSMFHVPSLKIGFVFHSITLGGLIKMKYHRLFSWINKNIFQ